jgi:hypothetical protein
MYTTCCNVKQHCVLPTHFTYLSFWYDSENRTILTDYTHTHAHAHTHVTLYFAFGLYVSEEGAEKAGEPSGKYLF